MTPSPPSWYDYAKKLPEGIPDTIYDAQRGAYFDEFVKPWAYQEGLDLETTRQKFFEKTPRIGKSEFPRVEVVAKSAAKALVDPVAGLAGERGVQQYLADVESKATTEAQKQGINPAPYQMIGSMAGQLPYWYGGMKLVGMAAKAVVAESAITDLAAATSKLEATTKLFNTAAGAAIQGSYNAAKAEDGHRMVEGLEGAAEGAALVGAFEYVRPLANVVMGAALGSTTDQKAGDHSGAIIGGVLGATTRLGALGRLLQSKHNLTTEQASALEQTAKGIANEAQTAGAARVVETTPDVVETVNQVVAEGVKAGKRRGRPRKTPESTPTADGVQIGVDLTEAQLVAARRAAPVQVINLDLTPEQIPEAANTISDALKKGGSIDSLNGNTIEVNQLLRAVDSRAVDDGLYDTKLQLRGEEGAPAAEVVLPTSFEVKLERVAAEARREAGLPEEMTTSTEASLAPESVPELPANPLIVSLREVLLNPKLTEAQKSASRVRLQRLSPETVAEIDATLAKPAGVTEVVSPPLEAPVLDAEIDPSLQLARAQELSRQKAKTEGVGQPTGARLGMADVSEFDHLEVLRSGKVRDRLSGKIYRNADEALRAKGLSAPNRFSAEDGEGTHPDWPESYWINSKGKSSAPLIDHLNWLEKNHPKYFKSEDSFIAAQQDGWFRVSGPAIDADIEHVNTKGFAAAVQKAAEIAKKEGQNEFYVHIYKGEDDFLSGRVDLPDIGEFLQNPVKFARLNWRNATGEPSKFAGQESERSKVFKLTASEEKIKLLDQQGKTLDEIAEILGVKKTSARTSRDQMRQKVRELAQLEENSTRGASFTSLEKARNPKPPRWEKGKFAGRENQDPGSSGAAWVTPEGKVHSFDVLGEHEQELEGVMKPKELAALDQRFGPDMEGYFTHLIDELGWIRVRKNVVDTGKLTGRAVEAAVAKAVKYAKETGEDHIFVDSPFGSAGIPVADIEAGESLGKLLLNYKVGQRPAKRMNWAGGGEEAATNPTQITDRPLQTRVTGQAAEDVLPPGTAAGTSAPYGQKPTIYYRNPNPTNIFHEGLHSHIGNLGLTGLIDHVVRQHPTGSLMESAFDTGLKKLYGTNWPEEAYVYAASALRTSNTKVLQPFIDADTDRPSVLRWIADNTDELLRGIAERPRSIHSDVAARRLREVLRRSSWELDVVARDSTGIVGDGLALEGGKYRVTDREGVSRIFDDREALAKHLEEKYEQPLSAPQLVDESLLPADLSRPQMEFDAHSEGRAPIYTDPPLRYASEESASHTLPEGGQIKGGFQALSNYTRPFYAWLSTVAEKNKWPELYDVFKSLDLAMVQRDNFTRPYHKLREEIFHGTSKARRSDFTRYLEAATEDKEKTAEALHLSDVEIGKLNRLRNEIYEPLFGEFNIHANTYIENYAPHMRTNGFNADAIKPTGRMTPEEVDFFARHVRTGELDPRDMDLDRVTSAYVELGARQKFLGGPLKAAAELVNLKNPEGSFVTGSLQPILKRHLEVIRGIPDYTGQVIDGAVNSSIESINGMLEKVNRKLPANLQVEPITATPRDVMGKFILLQYAGGLALRPVVVVKDALKVFITTYPILGGEYLAKGIRAAMKPGAWDIAEQAGALVNDKMLRSLATEDTGALSGLGKAAETALKPLAWLDNPGRLVTFWGHTERALNAMRDFKQHGDVEKLVRQSALTFADPPLQKSFVKEITSATPDQFEAIAYRIGKELTEVSHWNYRPGANPGIYKYTAGKLFGQYGTWPLNYIEYARRIASNPDKVEVAKTLTRLAAAHGAILAAGQKSGIDTAQWVFAQPMAYNGGPMFNAIVNIPNTTDFETYQGVQARRAVVQPIVPGLIPGGMAMERLHRAIAKDDPELYKIMLGFVPLKPGEESRGIHQLVP